MAKENIVIDAIEDAAGKTNLVDKGIAVHTKYFAPNAPTFELDRREFLKKTGTYSGLIAAGKLIALEELLRSMYGCSSVISSTSNTEPVTFQGKTYSDWEAYLLTQDWIRGPEPLYRPTGNLLYDNHLNRTGFYAIDYDGPIGTPIVPTADAFRTSTTYDRTGGNELLLVHRHKPRLPLVTWYVHLDKYANILSKGELKAEVRGYEVRDQELDKTKIIAFSGNTGVGPGGGVQRGHLHFQITEFQGGGQIGQGIPISPGFDPFQLGIDADKPFDEYAGKRVARPVYWDGKTEIPLNINQRKRLLQKSLNTLDRRVRESDLDKETKDELLKRHNNPEALKDYLGMLVLTKPTGKDGKMMNYRYLPGKLPYALMLEIFSRTSNQELIAMLPFISPFVKEVYQQSNPEVKF